MIYTIMSENINHKNFQLRPLTNEDRAWVEAFTAEHWGSDKMVVHAEVITISQLPGFAAEKDGAIAGLVTYHIANKECEILSLDSLLPGMGIGTALIEAVRLSAIRQGCRRLFLTTTNDNIDALLFYQKRGFELAKVRPGAVNASRLIKPEIPLVGYYGLPIRDEIEFEMILTASC
jgi:GNAT superfamily N-acetyltransferase